MHGDTVQITASPASKGKRPEGAVIRVIERANQTIVGFYQKNKNFGFVVPDNQKINADVFIPQGKDMGAVTGHKVVVHLTDFGGERKKPEGIITEIIGHVNDPGTDILSIVKAYGIPDEYPPEVMKQVSRIPDEVAKEDMAGRKDIRDWQTVTIDGETFSSWKEAHDKLDHHGKHFHTKVGRAWNKFPFPALVTLAYLVLGIVYGTWGMGLFLVFLLPVYYAIGDFIDRRHLSKLIEAIYPAAAIAWFLYMWLCLGQPHPAWIILITIPVIKALMRWCRKQWKHRQQA